MKLQSIRLATLKHILAKFKSSDSLSFHLFVSIHRATLWSERFAGVKFNKIHKKMPFHLNVLFVKHKLELYKIHSPNPFASANKTNNYKFYCLFATWLLNIRIHWKINPLMIIKIVAILWPFITHQKLTLRKPIAGGQVKVGCVLEINW
jgi:hypothetical protein